MLKKEQIKNKLRRGYSPIESATDSKLASIFKSAYRPLVDKRELYFLFELFETNEVRLRAWSFLGLHNVIMKNPLLRDDAKSRLHNIIIDLLNDERKIEYFGGSIEIKVSLREHHVRRLSDLDTALTFEPVFEYIKSLNFKTDIVVTELFENTLTKSPDNRVEKLILEHAENAELTNLSVINQLVNAFENLGLKDEVQEKERITKIFQSYLESLKKSITDAPKREKLKRNILRVGAVIELNLEAEILEFLETLSKPYNELYQIAEKYKANEKFTSILQKKIKETDNPHFMKDLLITLIAVKEEIENWDKLLLDNLIKFQLLDEDLITEISKADFLSENIIIDFFEAEDQWQVEFVREFLKNNPEKMDIWSKFRNEFIKILEVDYDDPNLRDKKETALKIIIDLEKEDMAKYCVDNFKNIENEELRKLALFALINFGNEALLLEVKSFIKEDKKLTDFVVNFWRKLERRDYKFYY
jgi:hypothetical protein